jgi:transcription elongation factor Elf1
VRQELNGYRALPPFQQERDRMKTEYHDCPHCGKANKVTIPEDFDDKVEEFLKGAPNTVLKGLASLAVGVFLSTPAGWITATALIVKSIHDDGTVKCGNCDARFRIR